MKQTEYNIKPGIIQERNSRKIIIYPCQEKQKEYIYQKKEAFKLPDLFLFQMKEDSQNKCGKHTGKSYYKKKENNVVHRISLGSIGSSIVKAVPDPSLLSIVILPDNLSSTRDFTMERPIPVPPIPLLVVKYILNIFF